jgi:hypothetical protein
MKVRAIAIILFLALTFTAACPSQSHAFAILRYLFDFASNQLGFDRGPIPKAPPNIPPTPDQHPGLPLHGHPDAKKLHIQAEGF